MVKIRDSDKSLEARVIPVTFNGTISKRGQNLCDFARDLERNNVNGALRQVSNLLFSTTHYSMFKVCCNMCHCVIMCIFTYILQCIDVHYNTR